MGRCECPHLPVPKGQQRHLATNLTLRIPAHSRSQAAANAQFWGWLSSTAIDTIGSSAIERVALLAAPPDHFRSRLGPAPANETGRAVWCHYAARIEADLDRNGTIRTASRYTINRVRLPWSDYAAA